mgnify:FL=1
MEISVSTQLENFCQKSASLPAGQAGNYDERMQQATNERRQNERVVSRSRRQKFSCANRDFHYFCVSQVA